MFMRQRKQICNFPEPHLEISKIVLGVKNILNSFFPQKYRAQPGKAKPKLLSEDTYL